MVIYPSLFREEIDIIGEDESKPVVNGTAPTMPMKFVNSSKSGTQTPKEDETWELDCEICGRRGINLVCISFSSAFAEIIYLLILG